MRIIDIETRIGEDFSGLDQHGFKRNKSTVTAMLQIQAKICEALENENLVAMISLDLSAAFDVVNHTLLMKRLNDSNLPSDVIDLIGQWLKNREAYVEIGGDTSNFFKVDKGTVQGSVLGPILFAIYVKDLLDIEPVTIYADDNYLVCTGNDELNLRNNVETKTKKLIKYLTDSGLCVNIGKTELVTFGPRSPEIEIEIDNVKIKSRKTMKVLGVIFDKKLDWSSHIADVTTKVMRIQFGLKCLKKYLTTDELLNLVTMLGMSKLYYGAPVWLSRQLHDINQRRLLRAGASLIKACLPLNDWGLVSFADLHQLSNKPTPMMMADHCQAMMLKKVMLNSTPELVWLKLQMNYRINRRTGAIQFGNGSVTPHGKHNFENRIQHISSKLPPGWENLTIGQFKVLSKRLFLKF